MIKVAVLTVNAMNTILNIMKDNYKNRLTLKFKPFVSEDKMESFLNKIRLLGGSIVSDFSPFGAYYVSYNDTAYITFVDRLTVKDINGNSGTMNSEFSLALFGSVNTLGVFTDYTDRLEFVNLDLNEVIFNRVDSSLFEEAIIHGYSRTSQVLFDNCDFTSQTVMDGLLVENTEHLKDFVMINCKFASDCDFRNCIIDREHNIENLVLHLPNLIKFKEDPKLRGALRWAAEAKNIVILSEGINGMSRHEIHDIKVMLTNPNYEESDLRRILCEEAEKVKNIKILDINSVDINKLRLFDFSDVT